MTLSTAYTTEQTLKKKQLKIYQNIFGFVLLFISKLLGAICFVFCAKWLCSVPPRFVRWIDTFAAGFDHLRIDRFSGCKNISINFVEMRYSGQDCIIKKFGMQQYRENYSTHVITDSFISCNKSIRRLIYESMEAKEV